MHPCICPLKPIHTKGWGAGKPRGDNTLGMHASSPASGVPLQVEAVLWCILWCIPLCLPGLHSAHLRSAWHTSWSPSANTLIQLSLKLASPQKRSGVVGCTPGKTCCNTPSPSHWGSTLTPHPHDCLVLALLPAVAAKNAHSCPPLRVTSRLSAVAHDLRVVRNWA
jgi:hypothetical protein